MPPKLAIKHKHNSQGTKRKIPNKEEQARLLILQRNCCFYCGLKFEEWFHDGEFARLRKAVWDHVSPYSFTFNSDPENFVAACSRCNGIKSNKIFTSLEDAAQFVRIRLKEKGYEMSFKWGTKSIRKFVFKRSMFEASATVFNPIDERATLEELRQRLKQIKEFQKMLKALPPEPTRLETTQ